MLARLAAVVALCGTVVSMPVNSAPARRLQEGTLGERDITLMVNQLSASADGYTTYQVSVRFNPSRVLDVYGTLRHIV